MKNRTTRRICLTALMAAITYVFTAYIHVPSHTGYTHVGDGFLYLAASLLPAPFAAAEMALPVRTACMVLDATEAASSSPVWLCSLMVVSFPV